MRKTFLEKCINLRLCRVALVLLFLVPAISSLQANPSQNKTISGVVTSATDSEPLIGVSVQVRETATGGITDIDGRYSVSAQQGQTLVFSYIGYQSQEIKVGTSSVINVVLKEDTEMLDEVVVVGYGVQKKKLVTGATVQVKGDEIAKMNTTNPLQAMQGQTPGVSIASTSGQPGADMKVSIRGLGTVGNSAPLYLIDGVGGDISTLNPADIERIDVLKDAASTAIYGSKSANGVIIITTRQGSTSTPQISVSYSLKQSRISHKLPQMNRQQGIDYEILRAYLQNSEPSAFARDTLNPSFTWDNNYQDILFRNAYTHQVDASISGAEKKLKYFLSAGYLSDEGIQLNSYNRRITSRVNVDYAATEKFLIGSRLSFATGNNRMVPYGGRSNILSRPASMALILPDGTYAPVVANRTNPLAYTMLCTNDNKYYDVNYGV